MLTNDQIFKDIYIKRSSLRISSLYLNTTKSEFPNDEFVEVGAGHFLDPIQVWARDTL